MDTIRTAPVGKGVRLEVEVPGIRPVHTLPYPYLFCGCSLLLPGERGAVEKILGSEPFLLPKLRFDRGPLQAPDSTVHGPLLQHSGVSAILFRLLGGSSLR